MGALSRLEHNLRSAPAGRGSVVDRRADSRERSGDQRIPRPGRQTSARAAQDGDTEAAAMNKLDHEYTKALKYPGKPGDLELIYQVQQLSFVQTPAQMSNKVTTNKSKRQNSSECGPDAPPVRGSQEHSQVAA